MCAWSSLSFIIEAGLIVFVLKYALKAVVIAFALGFFCGCLVSAKKAKKNYIDIEKK